MKHAAMTSNSKYSIQQAIDRVIALIYKLLSLYVDSAANIAALSLLDDTSISDGSSRFVRTVKDSFRLDKTSTALVDGITVAATMSGTGRWIRQLNPSAEYSYQATWDINATTGDDENTGVGAGQQLKTFAEFRRRVEPIGVRVEMTVNVETDLPPSDLIGLDTNGNSDVYIVGTKTVVYTGEVSVWADRTGTTGDLVRDAAWVVGDHIGRFIRFTSGAALGGGAWILEDMGANDARISIPGEDWYVYYPTPVAPSPGDTFEVETFTNVTTQTFLAYTGGILILNNLDLNGSYPYPVDNSSVVFAGCCNCYIASYGYFVSTNSYLYIMEAYGSTTCVVNLGAYGSLGAIESSICYAGYVTIDASLYGNYRGMASYSKSYAQFYNTWMFGDFGDSAIKLVFDSSINLTTILCGDITGTTRQGDIDSGCALLTKNFTHPITGWAQGFILRPDDIIVEINDGPITLPGSHTQLGTGTDFGSSGPVRAGVKGALTDGVRFALPDFTESVAEDLPFVVSSRTVARNLRGILATAPGGVDTVVVTVYLNGVATALSMTFTGAAVSAADTVDRIVVVPGDKISFHVNKSGAAANLSVSLEAG